ncbi:MAG TPA: alpha/beta fold hydrolase [Candidatus Binatia bacterium]
MKRSAGSILLGILVAAAAAAATPASAYTVPYGGSAMSSAISNEAFTPQSIVGANNGCKPTAAHPYPVVLVHATFADEGSNWVTLAPLLANNGYCVYAFNYGATWLSQCDFIFGCRVDALDSIKTSAGQLGSFISSVLSKTGATKVDLVGHSQGGMMPHYYTKVLGGAAKVHNFVALSPSNHGTTLDGLTTFVNKFPFWANLTMDLIAVIGAPSLTDQEVGSAFIKTLFGSGDPVMTGINYTVIQTKNDEVVTPYTNAFLTGSTVKNILIQNQCPNDPVAHIGMFDDSPAMQNVLNALSSSPNPNFTATCTNYGPPL